MLCGAREDSGNKSWFDKVEPLLLQGKVSPEAQCGGSPCDRKGVGGKPLTEEGSWRGLLMKEGSCNNILSEESPRRDAIEKGSVLNVGVKSLFLDMQLDT